MQMTDVKRTQTWTFQFVESLTLKQTANETVTVCSISSGTRWNEWNQFNPGIWRLSDKQCNCFVQLMQAGSSHHKKHLQRTPSFGFSDSESYFALTLLRCSGWYFGLQNKHYPVRPLTRPFATHHPLHAQSPTAAFPSHTFNAAVWPLIPAGAAGQRETIQEISTLSWLSMNDFKGTHRSYLQEISWKCTACAGKLVPVFYPVTCRISIQQREFKTTLPKPPTRGLQDGHFQPPEL